MATVIGEIGNCNRKSHYSINYFSERNIFLRGNHFLFRPIATYKELKVSGFRFDDIKKIDVVLKYLICIFTSLYKLQRPYTNPSIQIFQNDI